MYIGHLLAVIAASYLIYRYPKDAVALIIGIGILYNHGLKPVCNTPGISWNVVKVGTFIALLYGLYKGYYDLALISGYSFLSKFYPKAQNQVAPILSLLAIVVSVHNSYPTIKDVQIG